MPKIMDKKLVKNFLDNQKEFKLHHLTTESYHPLSKELSLYKEDTYKLLSIFKDVDLYALDKLKNYLDLAIQLKSDIHETIKSGGKVFLSGCGATGRLSLSLEFLYRKIVSQNDVISFMAGGDYALIKSVESFEDQIDFGSKQLMELGFSDNDLLIAITEGGETSFVIGTALKASKVSKRSPYFIYCNPDSELVHLKRCQAILSNDRVNKINLTCGPMAISGSTRMQATTVQQIFVGACLLYNEISDSQLIKRLNKIISSLERLNYTDLCEFVNCETSIYKAGEVVTYSCDTDLAICVLTDTTERSPTFSLKGFETVDDNKLSLSYLVLNKKISVEQAWHSLLAREPRCLDWKNINKDLTIRALYQFDISSKSIKRRSSLKINNIFYVENNLESIELSLKKHKVNISNNDDLFMRHLILKVLLNSLSSAIMVKLGRVRSNIMSYVKPSNFKLIDRATRYVADLAKMAGHDISYASAQKAILDSMENLEDGQSVVLKALSLLKV
ncbi:MAG: hypothetical protein N4A33_04855 [Bacteriovoracaceae bacterium]|nr:hypothetical protein [Bacteriovoracaceae bacterium]